MKLYLFLLFNLFDFFSPSQKPEHVKVADAIRVEVGDRLEKKHHIRIVGDYAALFDKINELGFRFQAVGPLTKDQLREILVDCVEDLVRTVNEKEGISQYLGVDPFTYKQVNIAIFLSDAQGRWLYYPYIEIASAGHGQLCFLTKEDGVPGYKTEETEDYQEALKKVRGL